jgi:hypothetical protein
MVNSTLKDAVMGVGSFRIVNHPRDKNTRKHQSFYFILFFTLKDTPRSTPVSAKRRAQGIGVGWLWFSIRAALQMYPTTVSALIGLDRRVSAMLTTLSPSVNLSRASKSALQTKKMQTK